MEVASVHLSAPHITDDGQVDRLQLVIMSSVWKRLGLSLLPDCFLHMQCECHQVFRLHSDRKYIYLSVLFFRKQGVKSELFVQRSLCIWTIKNINLRGPVCISRQPTISTDAEMRNPKLHADQLFDLGLFFNIFFHLQNSTGLLQENTNVIYFRPREWNSRSDCRIYYTSTFCLSPSIHFTYCSFWDGASCHR